MAPHRGDRRRRRDRCLPVAPGRRVGGDDNVCPNCGSPEGSTGRTASQGRTTLAHGLVIVVEVCAALHRRRRGGREPRSHLDFAGSGVAVSYPTHQGTWRRSAEVAAMVVLAASVWACSCRPPQRSRPLSSVQPLADQVGPRSHFLRGRLLNASTVRRVRDAEPDTSRPGWVGSGISRGQSRSRPRATSPAIQTRTSASQRLRSGRDRRSARPAAPHCRPDSRRQPVRRQPFTAYQQVYAKTWGKYKSIMFPTIGNHEYLTAGAAGYFEYFGFPPYYSFRPGRLAHHQPRLGVPLRRRLREGLAAGAVAPR